ncbi:MAG: hypothetical protein R2825_28480 [Saprospiraceae bacterium]
MFVKPHNISIDSATITRIRPSDGRYAQKLYLGRYYIRFWASDWSGGEVIGPIENPDARYISVGLITAEPTHPIVYNNGEETLLFTFIGDGDLP